MATHLPLAESAIQTPAAERVKAVPGPGNPLREPHIFLIWQS